MYIQRESLSLLGLAGYRLWSRTRDVFAEGKYHIEFKIAAKIDESVIDELKKRKRYNQKSYWTGGLYLMSTCPPCLQMRAVGIGQTEIEPTAPSSLLSKGR